MGHRATDLARHPLRAIVSLVNGAAPHTWSAAHRESQLGFLGNGLETDRLCKHRREHHEAGHTRRPASSRPLVKTARRLRPLRVLVTVAKGPDAGAARTWVEPPGTTCWAAPGSAGRQPGVRSAPATRSTFHPRRAAGSQRTAADDAVASGIGGGSLGPFSAPSHCSSVPAPRDGPGRHGSLVTP